MKTFFKKSSNQIVFLIVTLGIVIAIMTIMKSDNIGLKPPGVPEFEEQVKIIDNRYYNKPYHFGIALPNYDWDMVCVEKVDSIRTQNLNHPIIDNINVMVEMYRRDGFDTLAIVQVGVIDLIEPRTPQSLANQSLEEIQLTFTTPDTVRVVRDVTMSGAGSLRGAYYMIEFPDAAEYPYSVWISMFLVHNKLGYAIICQVREDDYEFLRTDFEDILKSFRLFKR